MNAERILIVEDEPVVALDLQQSLEELGHQVVALANSFELALEAVVEFQPSLILMDIHIDGKRDGIDACEFIYQRWQLPVIFLTAYADDKTVQRAALTKPFGYVMKPFETKELSAVIQVARARHDAELALAKSEHRLSVALDAAEMGSWEIDRDNAKLHGDERFYQLLGVQLTPFNSELQTLLQRVHPEDRNETAQLFESQEFFSHVFRLQKSHHQVNWLEIYGKSIRNQLGQQSVIGALRDITLRKNMEENLRQASVVFNTAVEGMLILNAQAELVNVNPAFLSMTGYNYAELYGHKLEDWIMVRRDSDPAILSIANSPQAYWTGESRCRRKNGSLVTVLQHVCAVKNEAGVCEQIVVSISDISFIREAERQLEHLAFHDSLTGLGNRYLLDQRMAQEMQKAERHGQRFAIVFIDLDGFKAINDSLGHHIGDRLIQEAAHRIQMQIRRDDVAIRLGGDEFVVLLSNLAHLDDGYHVAEKILQAMTYPIRIDDHQLRISASLGIARYPEDGMSMNELLSAADSAMYAAKHQGKARVCKYTQEMTSNVRARLHLEQGLHDAIAQQQLELFYQPVVSLQGEGVLGFEALIRWRHPELGLLGPDRFIQIAEETGLIVSIGEWIVEQALLQIQRWNHEFKKNWFVAVNVSPRQFLNSDFASAIIHQLRQLDLPAHCLEIEITESMLQDFQRSRRIVAALNEAGVSVAIDDFGTGYSSIALLKHLPVSRVKIDRSFVVTLPGTGRDLGLVAAILEMARSLDLTVTAEGIETLQQAEILAEVACPAAQGYYYSVPIPAPQLTASWLETVSAKLFLN